MARRRPSIDGAACSRGRLRGSNCAACAGACPRSALQVLDDGLEFGADTCSACGACVAACPQGAVQLGGLERLTSIGSDAVLVCPRHGGEICLQALGLQNLAALWLSGLRRLTALTGDCAQCPDGRGLDLEERLAVLNGILADRGLSSLTVSVEGTSPQRRLPEIVPCSVDLRRRALLGAGGTFPRTRPLATLQSKGKPGTMSAFAPVIDPNGCIGCDACLHLCPETALSLIRQGDGDLAYRTSSTNCSGCGLCVEICPGEALTLETAGAKVRDLALYRFRCRGCGVEVHVPESGPWAAGDICPICALTGRHKRLFQVLT